MWEWSDNLKLGKASVFVKRELRVLPLTDAEFEADFFLDPVSVVPGLALFPRHGSGLSAGQAG